jgi:hypothetical protein
MNPNRVFWILLIALAIVGFLLMMYITPLGIGLVNDSVGYIGSARNILAGDGYSRLVGDYSTRPVTNYPPMFSIVLAFIGLFGLEIVDAAWWLNVLLFSINIVLVSVIARKITANGYFGLATGLIFAISSPFLRAHVYAMTEPLFLLFSFLALWFMVKYIGASNWRWLAVSGLLAGFAFITRYVGVALFATSIFSLLIFQPDWKKRLKAGIIFLASGFPPVIIWLVRNMIVSENPANRSLIWHPIPLRKIQEGLQNFWGWLLPETFGIIEKFLTIWGIIFALLLILILALIIGLLVLYLRRRLPVEKENFILGWVFGLHALVYLGTLVVSMTFVDASPIFEDRILAPFTVCILIGIVVLLAWLWARKVKLVRLGVLLLMVILLLSLAEDSLDTVRDYHADGLGFSSATWRNSETIQAVNDLPEDLILFSNRITAIYILTDRPAFILPSPLNPATNEPRENYVQDVAFIRDEVNNQGAVMVVFWYQELIQDPEDRVWMDDLTSGLPVLLETNDGIIFGYTP